MKTLNAVAQLVIRPLRRMAAVFFAAIPDARIRLLPILLSAILTAGAGLALSIALPQPVAAQEEEYPRISWGCYSRGITGDLAFHLLCGVSCTVSPGVGRTAYLSDGVTKVYGWRCPNSDLRKACSEYPCGSAESCAILGINDYDSCHPNDRSECARQAQAATGARCVVPPPDSSGDCYTNTINGATVCGESCPSPKIPQITHSAHPGTGETIERRSCVCPDGYLRSDDGACVYIDLSCEAPWVVNSSGTECVCPSGTHSHIGEVCAPRPGTPTLTYNHRAFEVTISWTAAPGLEAGEVEHVILRRDAAYGQTFASVGATTGLSFTDAGAPDGADYLYKIRTRGGAGPETESDAASIQIPPAQPPGTSEDECAGPNICASRHATCLDKELDLYNSFPELCACLPGFSMTGGDKCAAPPAQPPPPDVIPLRSRIFVEAKDPADLNGADIAGYEFWREHDGSGSFALVTTLDARLLHDYTDWPPGTTLRYKSRILSNAGPSPLSEASTPLVIPAASDSPRAGRPSAAVARGDLVYLVWAPPGETETEITGYDVFREEDLSGVFVSVAYARDEAHIDRGAPFGVTLRYKVRARDASDFIDESESEASNPALIPPPSAPSAPSAALQPDYSIIVGWRSHADASRFRISAYHVLREVDGLDGFMTVVVAPPMPALTYSHRDNSPPGGVTIRYRVQVGYGESGIGPVSDASEAFSIPPEVRFAHVPSDGRGGTLTAQGVRGDGELVDWGATITFTATPTENYYVADWGNSECENAGDAQNAGVEKKCVLHANANVYATVTFSPAALWAVSFDAGGLSAAKNGAGLSSGDLVPAGSTVIFTALVPSGYEVSLWTNNDAAVLECGPALSCGIAARSELNVAALFSPIARRITYSRIPSDGAGGTLTVAGTASGGTVDHGATVTFTATPAEGYYVSGWNDSRCEAGGLQAPGAVKECGLFADSDLFVTATFSAARLVEYGGGVSAATPSGAYVADGATVTFAAAVPLDYKMSMWTNNSAAISECGSELFCEVSANDDLNVAALFSRISPFARRITYSHIPPDGAGGTLTVAGTASGGTVALGAKVIFTAVPAEKYYVSGWSSPECGDVGDLRTPGAEKECELSADADLFVTATFSAARLVEYGGGVSAATPSGAYVEDKATVIFSAAVPSGYEMSMWTNNNAAISKCGSELSCAVLANDDLNVAALFSPIARTITITYSHIPSDGAGGTLTVAGTASGESAAPGTSLTFTATPAEGFYVSGWSHPDCEESGDWTRTGEVKSCALTVGDADLTVAAAFAVFEFNGRAYHQRGIQLDRIYAPPLAFALVHLGTRRGLQFLHMNPTLAFGPDGEILFNRTLSKGDNNAAQFCAFGAAEGWRVATLGEAAGIYDSGDSVEVTRVGGAAEAADYSAAPAGAEFGLVVPLGRAVSPGDFAPPPRRDYEINSRNLDGDAQVFRVRGAERNEIRFPAELGARQVLCARGNSGLPHLSAARMESGGRIIGDPVATSPDNPRPSFTATAALRADDSDGAGLLTATVVSWRHKDSPEALANTLAGIPSAIIVGDWEGFVLQTEESADGVGLRIVLRAPTPRPSAPMEGEAPRVVRLTAHLVPGLGATATVEFVVEAESAVASAVLPTVRFNAASISARRTESDGGAAVLDDESVPDGATVIFSALVAEHHRVSAWFANGDLVSSCGADLECAVAADGALLSVSLAFARTAWRVGFSQFPPLSARLLGAEGGVELSDGDYVADGATVLFSAAALEGRRVGGWFNNGAAVSECGMDLECRIVARGADLNVQAAFVSDYVAVSLSATVFADGAVSLWWTAAESAEVSSYAVFREEEVSGVESSLAVVSVLFYVDEGAPRGMTVRYRVQAVVSEVESPQSTRTGLLAIPPDCSTLNRADGLDPLICGECLEFDGVEFMELRPGGLCLHWESDDFGNLSQSDVCLALRREGDKMLEGNGTVCSGVDVGDSFCILDSPDAFPCRGLFKHVLRCNLNHNRPAMNMFFCGPKCVSGAAIGAECR